MNKILNGTNDKSTQIKNPRGRTRKNSTTITVDDVNCETQNKSACYVQVAQNSTEFLASDGNLENNEEILITYKRKRKAKENKERNEESALIKRPRRRPKSNSKEVTADDPNCEDHSMPLDVQVPEDSAEFLSPDVNHDNCNEKSALMKTTPRRGLGCMILIGWLLVGFSSACSKHFSRRFSLPPANVRRREHFCFHNNNPRPR